MLLYSIFNICLSLCSLFVSNEDDESDTADNANRDKHESGDVHETHRGKIFIFIRCFEHDCLIIDTNPGEYDYFSILYISLIFGKLFSFFFHLYMFIKYINHFNLDLISVSKGISIAENG